jgi:hypothetical protein
VFLRFVFAEAEPTTRRRVGILRASTFRDEEALEESYGWLKVHLPVPPRAVFSAGRGLCWFKLEARPCIEHVREIAFFLEHRRGERIWQIYSRNPGLITYEDDFQIVAVPESAIARFG